MQTKSRTSLVLMELIITILFFSLCSAVCVQFFVNAHLTSKKAEELNRAVSKAQGFAEAFRGTDGSYESLIKLYPEAISNSDSSFTVYYDEGFNSTSSVDNAVYVSNISFDTSDNIIDINIVIDSIEHLNYIKNINETYIDNDYDTTDDLDPIYSLSVTKYIK